MHEASLYDRNAFITLTYADEHLPDYGSLDKGAFPRFMKRLRKKHGKVRYYHCGEYGEDKGRPHYHACLFGLDFADKKVSAERGEYQVWTSESLESVWGLGRTEVGSVTFESAAYIARYITKKVTGRRAQAHYERVDIETGEIVSVTPEYTTMSRRPGIGKGWLDKYGPEVYPSDSVIVRGREMKPPRFYDKQYEMVDPEGSKAVQQKRRDSRRIQDETPERLQVREVCAIRRATQFSRELK